MLYVACDSLAEPRLTDTLMCIYIIENANRHEYGEVGAWYIYIYIRSSGSQAVSFKNSAS